MRLGSVGKSTEKLFLGVQIGLKCSLESSQQISLGV